MPLYSIHHRGHTSRRFEHSRLVALETDTMSGDTLPGSIRAATDFVVPETLSWPNVNLPEGADGIVTWLAGDCLIQGSPASIRHCLHSAGRRSFVPLHLPCFDEMPLLALEPRWLSRGPSHDYWDPSTRIARSSKTSARALNALQSTKQVWAQLSQALLREIEKPGGGIATLEAIWETNKQSFPLLSALALRNLVVLLLRLLDAGRARHFLELGLQTFPGYAELAYLAAWQHIREGHAARAVAYLERAKSGDRGLLGCGGESSYRVDWLLGQVALRVGNERMAFDRLRSSLAANPTFSPAIADLLCLRLPTRLVAIHQRQLQQIACRNPVYCEKIFDFLLSHRAFEGAQELLEANCFRGDTEQSLRDRLRSARDAFLGRPKTTDIRGILFGGPFFEHTSLGRINREVAASALSVKSWAVRLEPCSAASAFPRLFPKGDVLEASILHPLERLDLTVRHQWPPDFRRPSSGKLAVILPWEYGAIPRAWVRDIEKNVDELWVPSKFVGDVCRRSGIDRVPIEVIPNGFDHTVFAPQGPGSRPHGCRKFSFLFVGGAIRRKGIDLLLDAYQLAFDPGEDVTLVAHISGLGGSYRHNSLTRRLQEMAADSHAPHLQILSDSLDDLTLARLYRGCNVLVLPYRGEGFGMPLLEAMACGKTVITTSLGPARDFCDPEVAYFVSAREQAVPDDSPPLGEFAREFSWFEPDVLELAALMRRCYESPQEAADRGRAAAVIVQKKFSWNHVTGLYRKRIRRLVDAHSVLADDCEAAWRA